MHKEQKIRIFLFCLSVAVFFAGLPFILSYALGYKFNPQTLRFSKTGLIALKTQPPGASVYLEKKLLKDKTPATINELLPGAYQLKVVLEEYYPWVAEVNIEAGKVARFEKIILFPMRPEVEKLSSGGSLSFWRDDKRGAIYYLDRQDESIYCLESDDEESKRICGIPQMLKPPLKWRPSPDGEKLLCFDLEQMVILPLSSQGVLPIEKTPFSSNVAQDNIVDIFWHSDSYHLILVTDKNIAAIEARRGSKPVGLINLNKKDTSACYDVKADMLYFLDSERAGDGKLCDNIYRLNLSTRFFPFRELIKLRTNGQGQKTKKKP